MQSSSNLSEFWGKRVFAIVTGASRGIGKTLVEKLGGLVAPGSVLLLMSRDAESLNTLQATIESRCAGVHVHVGVADLSASDENTLNEMVRAAVGDRAPGSFDHALCVHNAGSLGDASKRCADLIELSPCLNYFQLNLASVVVLNALFLRGTSTVERKTVVNISSLCGVEPFASLALYCAGKAARDMFFKVRETFIFFSNGATFSWGSFADD